MRRPILLGAAIFSLLGPAAIAGDQQGIPYLPAPVWQTSACPRESPQPLPAAAVPDPDPEACPAVDPATSAEAPAVRKPLLHRLFDQFSLDHRVAGLASYYSSIFDGRKTASGETFHNGKYSAAHLTLPLGTWVEVKSRATGRKLRLKVNDRGPYAKKFVLDLSRAAARFLGVDSARDRYVEIRVIALPGEDPPASDDNSPEAGEAVAEQRSSGR